MTVRFGIVGAGMIAAVHLEALRGLPGAQPVGIMDRGSGRGAALAPDLDATGSDDLESFVAREDVDAISVATASGAHLEAALAAARAGKHCIVEKPIEIAPDRVDRMIEAHRAAGTTLGGIFNTRYDEAAVLLERAVDAGRFGRLTYASAVGPWWRDQSYYDESAWKGTWALDGGGALMNQGIHSVDLLQWIVGRPVVQVSGRIATLAHERIEVEDTGAATLVFDGGALGQIACTTSMWPGHFRTITVAGNDGTAVLADSCLAVWRFREERPEDEGLRQRLGGLPGEAFGASSPTAGLTAQGHRAAFAEFVAALEAGRPPAVDGAEARKAVAIIRAIYDSAGRDGRPVAPA
jgi:predicted dehydrogenase